jgi:hypothetical protein
MHEINKYICIEIYLHKHKYTNICIDIYIQRLTHHKALFGIFLKIPVGLKDSFP